MKSSKPLAFITGATSGIGKCFATRFAESGYNLALTGRREPLLRELANRLKSTYSAETKLLIGDFADDDFRREIVEMLKNDQNIEVLVNNAGFGIDKAFCDVSDREIESMIKTHVDSTVEFTRAVLPGMMIKRKGIIINVASLGAFIPGITRCLYMSSKSFIHSLSVGLSMEMAPFGIKIQSLCPGMTRTDFHRQSQNAKTEKNMQKIHFMKPETVVDISLHYLDRNRVHCIPGKANNFYYYIAMALPKRVLRQISSFRLAKENTALLETQDRSEELARSKV